MLAWLVVKISNNINICNHECSKQRSGNIKLVSVLQRVTMGHHYRVLINIIILSGSHAICYLDSLAGNSKN